MPGFILELSRFQLAKSRPLALLSKICSMTVIALVAGILWGCGGERGTESKAVKPPPDPQTKTPWQLVNVTTSDGAVRNRTLSYERDAIRPNVLGKFRVILGATAKHPAMLYYLDNAQSRSQISSLSSYRTWDGAMLAFWVVRRMKRRILIALLTVA